MRNASVYENIAGGIHLFMRKLQEECISLCEHCRRNASIYENIAGGIHQFREHWRRMHLFMRTLQEECSCL